MFNPETRGKVHKYRYFSRVAAFCCYGEARWRWNDCFKSVVIFVQEELINTLKPHATVSLPVCGNMHRQIWSLKLINIWNVPVFCDIEVMILSHGSLGKYLRRSLFSPEETWQQIIRVSKNRDVIVLTLQEICRWLDIKWSWCFKFIGKSMWLIKWQWGTKY